MNFISITMSTLLKKFPGLLIVAGLCSILMCECKNATPKIIRGAYQCDVTPNRERIKLEFRNNPFEYDSTAFMRILLNNNIAYCGKYQESVFINFDTLCKKDCLLEVDIRKDGSEHIFSNRDVNQITSADCKINAVFTKDNSDNMLFIITCAGIDKKHS